MVIEAKKVATPSDFSACPIWRYDDEDDLYHPVLTADELPESERLLSIRARFVTPNGQSFDGYVVGIERVFSIGLFGGGQVFHVNKNLPDLSEKQLQAFLQTQPGPEALSTKALFPLSYTTTINREPFADFSGKFEMTS
ncbi:hypothetical protein ACI2VK_08010 [Ralstonia nicotianae]|uniref:hypothetical protein n=1 Tax=Ralstonia pseudosolanacearum TaxID=1310165 RepID=UPI0013C4D266|nr:hypothetical protein [Ralstonia pseudosolanacearum]MBX9432001.1 hypothetical protein [Ralstonia pseudosolanacearum]MCF1441356.1 hypothetical protein [Ralstonia solanacearum]